MRKYQNYEELVTNLNLRLEGLREQKLELECKLEIDSIEARLKKFLECFSNATESQKRDILEMVFKRVIVLKNNKLKVVLWGDSIPPKGRNNFLYKKENGVFVVSTHYLYNSDYL